MISDQLVKIGTIDLEILYLGISHNGRFNENDIEDSDLKRLGVGKILDTLASLKEKNLINLNTDGSFQVTDLARSHLWDKKIPLWTRILRLLDVQSESVTKISEMLRESYTKVENELENLRKSQLVLMSPIRKEGNVIKSFEILQEGKEYLEKIKTNGIPEKILGSPPAEIEILELLDDIIKEVNNSDMPKESQDKIISKINQIRNKLNV